MTTLNKLRIFATVFISLGACAAQQPADLLKDPTVSKALEIAKRNEPQILAEQARIAEIPAPPFKEEVRGKELQRVFTQVSRAVQEASRGLQVPEIAARSLTVDVVLAALPAQAGAASAAPAAPGENATKQTAASRAMATAIVGQLGRSWMIKACMDNLLAGERANRFPVDAFATLVLSAG